MDHECIQEKKINLLETKLSRIDKNVAILVELKEDIKSNTAFRQQAKGAFSLIAGVFTVLGILFGWVFNKFS